MRMPPRAELVAKWKRAPSDGLDGRAVALSERVERAWSLREAGDAQGARRAFAQAMGAAV